MSMSVCVSWEGAPSTRISRYTFHDKYFWIMGQFAPWKRTIRKPEVTSKTSFCRDINFFYPKDILFKRLTKRLNQAYDDQLSEGKEFFRWEWHILVSMSFFLYICFFLPKTKTIRFVRSWKYQKVRGFNILTFRFVISGCLNIFRKTTITSLFGKRLYNLYIVYMYVVFDRITLIFICLTAHNVIFQASHSIEFDLFILYDHRMFC